ncbi:MAG: hypothetical protein N5P05_004673 (plasmid) [Chroococcopsis gigantea SAG 12.99]|jgi:hypothetical protein|nr:hypothetical protein [Chroococcopsis gigantea SAG 12.99]
MGKIEDIKKALFLALMIVALAVSIIMSSSAAESQSTSSPVEISQKCPKSRSGSSDKCPLPITVRRGSFGALIDDRLTEAPQVRYYSLHAKRGQRLTITFAGSGALRGGITFPAGGGDGPFYGDGNTIELPLTGNYIIYVGQNTMSGEPWVGTFSIALIIK